MKWIGELGVVSCLLATSLLVFGPEAVEPERAKQLAVDADRDGLLNVEELAGARTHSGATYVSDPDVADTDGDGLTDGEELGVLSDDPVLETAYLGHSDPVVADTDDDGIGDADEYFVGTDAFGEDTDGDGLDDAGELAFGSDPLTDNSDGDSFDDLAELTGDFDPADYDLGDEEARSVFLAGAGYGSCHWCAKTIGGVTDEQIESLPYVSGHIAGGFLPFADARDLIAGIAAGDFGSAGLSAAGLVPGAGDAYKAAKLLKDFAKVGASPWRRAYRYITLADWGASVTSEVLSVVFGAVDAYVPEVLAAGSREYSLYLGLADDSQTPRYVGITADLDATDADDAATCTVEVLAEDLALGEARAIGEALVARDDGALDNELPLMSPELEYYDDALAWGEDWLATHGVQP